MITNFWEKNGNNMKNRKERRNISTQNCKETPSVMEGGESCQTHNDSLDNFYDECETIEFPASDLSHWLKLKTTIFPTQDSSHKMSPTRSDSWKDEAWY